MTHDAPITIELDLGDALGGVPLPPHGRLETTLELELEAMDADPTLEEERPVRHALHAALGALAPRVVPAKTDEVTPEEATSLLRRAQSLFVAGALTPGMVGAADARERFDRALGRAERSRDHAAAAARLRARAARAEGRTDEAIAELKRALHSIYDPVASRAIFAELAELYGAKGEPSEAAYYAKRAGSEPPPPVAPPSERTRAVRPSTRRAPPPPLTPRELAERSRRA